MNERLIREVHRLILGLEGRGVRVEFWRANKRENRDALRGSVEGDGIFELEFS